MAFAKAVPQPVPVNCINKRDRFNTHESISHIGGVFNGQPWKMTTTDAIAELQSIQPRWSFYTTTSNGKTAWVEVVHGPNGRKWLQTRADRVLTNNLLYLSECA